MELLKQLDEILKGLLDSKNYQLTLDELKIKVTDEDSPNSDIESKLVAVEEKNNITARAVKFLSNEGYVTLSSTHIILEYKGIVKIQTGGFVQEAKDKNFKAAVNNFFWIATPIISFIALIVSIWSVFISYCS